MVRRASGSREERRGIRSSPLVAPCSVCGARGADLVADRHREATELDGWVDVDVYPEANIQPGLLIY